uniref:Uncharacterized protein n=1 Tax=Trichuris muris TaxID=70415 RepID=A0A5S6QPU6_TRIMR
MVRRPWRFVDGSASAHLLPQGAADGRQLCMQVDARNLVRTTVDRPKMRVINVDLFCKVFGEPDASRTSPANNPLGNYIIRIARKCELLAFTRARAVMESKGGAVGSAKVLHAFLDSRCYLCADLALK